MKKLLLSILLLLTFSQASTLSVLGGALKSKDGQLNVGSTSYIATFNVNGGGYFNGIVTADSFIGDGSGLTNVAASTSTTANVALNSLLLNNQIASQMSVSTSNVSLTTNYYLETDPNVLTYAKNTAETNLEVGTANVGLDSLLLNGQIASQLSVDTALTSTTANVLVSNLVSQFTNDSNYITSVSVVTTASYALDSDKLDNQQGSYYVDLTNATNTLDNDRLPENIEVTGIITANSFVGALTGQADTVSTITGLAPDTATTQAAQPNITSVGTLTSLTMSGALTGATTGAFSGDVTISNTQTGGNAQVFIGNNGTDFNTANTATLGFGMSTYFDGSSYSAKIVNGWDEATNRRSYLKFYTNNSTNQLALTIDYLRNITLASTTESTSTTTGAFKCAGGGAFAKNLNVGGTVKVGAYTLPATDGTNGQVLVTNGSGVLTWTTL